jgi:uncharacterized membrane protein
MISGFIFALFLTGLLLTLIFFKEVKILERMLLSITFSIMLTIALAIMLGYNEEVKNITGGITAANLWKWELAITGILSLVALIVNWKKIKGFKFSKMKLRFSQ